MPLFLALVGEIAAGKGFCFCFALHGHTHFSRYPPAVTAEAAFSRLARREGLMEGGVALRPAAPSQSGWLGLVISFSLAQVPLCEGSRAIPVELSRDGKAQSI